MSNLQPQGDHCPPIDRSKPQRTTMTVVVRATVTWTTSASEETSADDLATPPRALRAVRSGKTLMARTIEAIETVLPPGRTHAMLAQELMHRVMDATGCGLTTYRRAHSQVEFGQGWMVPLPDGHAGLMTWRPSLDGTDMAWPRTESQSIPQPRNDSGRPDA